MTATRSRWIGVNDLIRRGVKYLLRRGAIWLSQSDAAADRDHVSFDDEFSVYPELNHIFEQMHNERRGGFRSSYAWCVLHAAHLAKALGIREISVIEFGVAGGNGLLALERAAERVEGFLGVRIQAYGFDTGTGLPKPQDLRDLPNLYREGHFPMDRDRLVAQLRHARLILGEVRDTLPAFFAADPPPIGLLAVDLDLYSATVHALKVLLAEPRLLLPRVHCYFDDILGYTFADHNGARLAIAEFNQANEHRKISPIYGLRYFVPRRQRNSAWTEQVYLAHILDHELYAEHDGLGLSTRLDLASD